MKFEEFKEILEKQASLIDINLTEVQIKKFYQYLLLLLKWNEKINLTAITEIKEIILKHFIDSLTICKYIPKNAKFMDVGTGAGFPGIPIKIVREDVEVTLLDSLNKRILFLNEVIKSLEIKKIEAVHGRAEELGRNKKYRQKFDIVTSRAVANLSILSEYLIPFTKINGKIVIMKGSEIEEEVKNAEKAIRVLGGTIVNIDKFLLPESDMKRNIILIEKISDTPNQYPRKAGTPAKNPIH